MGKRLEIRGKRFGKLVAITPAGINRSRLVLWKCVCDCGQEIIVTGANLASGNSKSCGCARSASLRLRNTTHGKSRRYRSTYTTWRAMITRCTNPKIKCWKHYGGRGITVCDRWLNSFDNFLDDMGEKPPGMTIDRIDSDKGYCKDNCRWATQAEQTRNRRSVLKITWNGKTQIAAEWADELGIPRDALYYRLRSGWTVERALSTTRHSTPP